MNAPGEVLNFVKEKVCSNLGGGGGDGVSIMTNVIILLKTIRK